MRDLASRQLEKGIFMFLLFFGFVVQVNTPHLTRYRNITRLFETFWQNTG